MNQHTTDTMIAALRDLDPAPESVLTEADRQRADDMFDRIVSTPSEDPTPVMPDRPRRRGWRLLTPIGLVGAAGAAVGALLLGGSAFASWTSTPEPLSPAQASAAAATCGAGTPAAGQSAVIAERRGKWTYVLISGPNGEASCLMRNNVVGRHPNHNELFGSSGPDTGKAPTVAHDRLVETGSMATSVDEGWLRADSWLTWTYGYVGSDVSDVTVHTPLGFDVEASVDNGRFAAWWPSDLPGSKNLDAMGPWSYTVTLADGSTRDGSG